jgi:type VI secretion system Hcp family effector
MRTHRPALAVALAGACALGAAGGWASGAASARPAAARPAGGTALAALTTPLAATASDPLFLHVSGIPGESADHGHAGWIDISGYHAALSAATSQSGVGRAQLGPLVVTLPLSRATPPLMSALATGRNLGTVVLQAASISSTGTEQNYLTITLSSTSATAIQESSGGSRPSDSLTLTATTIAVSYTAANGATTSFCFNFLTNQAC